MRLLAIAALLAAYSSAQDPSQDPTSTFTHPKAAWKAFQAEHDGHWVVEWCAATGTPSYIYGMGLPLAGWSENSLAAARVHANQMLVTHHDLLGLGTSEFRESIGARMGRTWSFTFDQYFRGLPVIDGRADVRVNMSGVVAMIGSRAWPIAEGFNTTPAIAEELASGIAWAKVGKLTGVPQPGANRKSRLVIWGDIHADAAAPVFLAWEVPISNVDAGGVGPIGRYYVDAQTGAVLNYRNDKHECGLPGCTVTTHATQVNSPAAALLPVPTTVTVTGWTRIGLDATDPLVNVPLRNQEFTVPGIGSVVTDANGQFTIDIAAAVNITVGALNGTHHSAMIDSTASGPTGTFTVNPGVATTIQLLTNAATTNQAAHTSCSYWIDQSNEWARSILGNSAQLNTADAITPTVNQTGTCNAYYTGNTIHFYPTGGGCNNTAFSTVVTHEWGHGLDERYGGISNNSGDGLSEGWGDLLGCYLMDSPNLGQGFQTPGVPLRSGLNTKMYGTQTEVHAAGEIWMGFAWRYRENLRAAFGTPAAITISNDTAVASIVANATNQANAVTEVFIADDNDGILANGTPHYAQLSAAAIAKGMPYPQIQVATIAHNALGNTTQQLSPRRVDATVAVVSGGSITQVRLFYNAGAGAQIRTMVPNGNANGYAAMLPGIVSGSVQYHIEAVHNATTTVRLPASGEYSYTVTVPTSGPFVGFHLTDFNANNGGFTSGLYSGTTQDWQWGPPNGKTGTSLGVVWSDPSAASANGSTWGTDLGAGTANGAYLASRSYWLRSPAINCSGRTGCFLRFRRWLTVEEGIYDQAAIYVNGIQVWANPLNGNLVDTAWSTVEYPIPMADNNAAVTVEFRLTTDAGLQLGGWNIDDFELGTKTIQQLPAEWRMLPEQAVQGTPVTATVFHPAGAMPFLIALADSIGPTFVPGFPVMQVGGNILLVAGATDASGNATFPITAPTPPSAVGLFYYSQVLTLDPTFTQFVVSNPYINLFTQ